MKIKKTKDVQLVVLTYELPEKIKISEVIFVMDKSTENENFKKQKVIKVDDLDSVMHEDNID